MARQYIKNGGLGQIDLSVMLERIGLTVQDEIRATLATLGLPDDQTVRIQKRIVVETKENTVAILLPDYYRFIESGRRPGSRYPPAAEILAWMKRKRIAVGEENKVLYIIRKTIAEQGIRPRPFVLLSVERAGVNRIPQIFTTFATEYADEALNTIAKP